GLRVVPQPLHLPRGAGSRARRRWVSLRPQAWRLLVARHVGDDRRGTVLPRLQTGPPLSEDGPRDGHPAGAAGSRAVPQGARQSSPRPLRGAPLSARRPEHHRPGTGRGPAHLSAYARAVRRWTNPLFVRRPPPLREPAPGGAAARALPHAARGPGVSLATGHLPQPAGSLPGLGRVEPRSRRPPDDDASPSGAGASSRHGRHLLSGRGVAAPSSDLVLRKRRARGAVATGRGGAASDA